MTWRELSSDDDGLEGVERQLSDMLLADRHSFDLAAAALLAGAEPHALRHEVSDSDHRVNQGVQQIRRQLVVHAITHGERADVTVVLAYMSVVKDIERIGDYAKNILDIARAGGDLSRPSDDRDELVGLRDRISQLIGEVNEVFTAQDPDRATQLLIEWDPVLADLDDRVAALVTTQAPGLHAVPRALYYRHLKRIGAHLMNILTALVMPLDKLDFFWKHDRPSP